MLLQRSGVGAGFGGTAELPADEFSLRGYAQWVADLLDSLEIEEPAVVVGHSFGGGVSVRFAHDFRSRVRSLVLVNYDTRAAIVTVPGLAPGARLQPLYPAGTAPVATDTLTLAPQSIQVFDIR